MFDPGNEGYLLVDLDPAPEEFPPFLGYNPETTRLLPGQSAEHGLECLMNIALVRSSNPGR